MLARVERRDGTTRVARLTPANPSVLSEASPSHWQVVRTYLVLGVKHILTGIDHLLFVLALLIITGGRWKLVKTVTTFTIAHSITLTAATLGIVHMPQRPVEAVCEGLAAQRHFIDDAGLTVWPDGTSGGCYRFQHALYQQVLYEQVGTARRGQIHRRIGVRLEAGYGTRAGEIAAQLAVHCERSGATSQAIRYAQQAAENAARRNAPHEAIAALTKGLALLATLPESPERFRHELALQLTLGELLMAAKGMAAVEAGEAYTRAHALCQQGGEAPQLFRVLWGLILFHLAQAQFRTAAELCQQCFALGQRQHDAVLLLLGHLVLGMNACLRGNLVEARAHLEQCLSLCDTQQPPIPTFLSKDEREAKHRTWFAQVLWGLGYADQAQQRSQEALALARRAGNSSTLAYVEFFATMLTQYRRDATATYARAEALMGLAAVQGFVLRGEQGRILQGWALAMQGNAAEGVAQIRQGLAAIQDIGPKLFRPYFLALLAEAYSLSGQPEAGLQVLAEALTLVEKTEGRWWEVELYRLKGELLLQLPHPDVPRATAAFLRALDVARRQQAKALELRAALHLSRLWQAQGQPAAAQALLADIYGWFTEGLDTADLQAAQAVLEALKDSPQQGDGAS